MPAAKKKLFEWECPDGSVLKLPSLADMDPDLDVLEAIKEDLRSDNPLINLPAHRRYILSSVPDVDEKALRAVTRRASQFMKFMEAWQEFSGISAGES